MLISSNDSKIINILWKNIARIPNKNIYSTYISRLNYNAKK